MMLKEMKNLAKEETICVLATVNREKPYCSLMAYVTDENCEEIYMVTLRNTQKYKNLNENPPALRQRRLQWRVCALK
jgi:nitroimidazol reductase NimA-like FMN-containing flavoprotein (pyridoxamine 5'-phosphate oxidase superfamily)